MDGVTILLDGVCQEGKPYLTTPPQLRERLATNLPDVLAFTHTHNDHYDPDFAAHFGARTNGVIFGPKGIPGAIAEPKKVGSVQITPIPSRHIGKAGLTMSHISYVIEGSACVWFLGDATPTMWREPLSLPKPDVLIVPYAYATTESAWSLTRQLGATQIVLLHLPHKDADVHHLWDAVQTVTQKNPFSGLYIPEIGETISL